MAARSRGTGPPPLATVHSVHFHTLIIRGRVARISCKFPWKCPLREGRGNKKKRRKREREINVHYCQRYFRLEIVLPMLGALQRVQGKKGGFGNPYLLNQPSASPYHLVGNLDVGKKRYLFIYIYIFFHSPLLTNIWRALHLFSTGKLDNSVKFARMKKGGTGRGGGVARVQNTICSQREKKRKKRKNWERKGRRGREKF